MESTRLANKTDGPLVIKIINDSLIEELKNFVLEHWIYRKNSYFPAPQPVSLERKDLSKLTSFDYYVCAKSDGMRFLFILYKNNCYMVDRSFKFYKTDFKFKELSSFILDGELVKNNNNKWIYVIHDCVDYDGINFIKEMFDFRQEYISKIINKMTESQFDIIKKSFEKFENFEEFSKKTHDHYTDGFIFTPKNKGIGNHTQFSLFKWKPKEKHTFDFKIFIDKKKISAFVNQKGTPVPYADVELDTEDGHFFKDELYKKCPEFENGAIIECIYENDRYIPIIHRQDKNYANNLLTVSKTLNNIKENITINDLVKESKKINQ